MERDKDIEKQYTLSNKQVLGILVSAVFATFSLTTIYNKFLFNEEEIQLNKVNITNIESIVGTKASNERLDKKTKRIEDRLEIIEEEVKRLKEPNSDK